MGYGATCSVRSICSSKPWLTQANERRQGHGTQGRLVDRWTDEVRLDGFSLKRRFVRYSVTIFSSPETFMSRSILVLLLMASSLGAQQPAIPEIPYRSV